MRLSFRQGIVRYQTPTFLSVGGSFVSLVVTDTQCIVAFADGTKDYLYVEQESVSSAWGPLFTGVDQWLYWDIERRTGIRTFGITTVEPVLQNTEPASPAIDQHWFDTSVNQMKVWNGVRWLDRIRVFACKLSGGVVPSSMSINAPDFDGTQAGLVTDAFAGPILFDANTNQPLKTPDHKFITTEDKFATRTISFSDIKLAALILSAEAQQNMSAYTVVRFTGFDEIIFADAFTSQQLGQFGIIEQDVLTGEFTNVVLEGVITNPTWAWTTVNAPLYSDATGTLTDVAPIPNAAPVAIVVGASTIIFGSPKNIFNNFDVQVELATSIIHGLVRLNIPAASALDPIAIGANDPRLTYLNTLTGDVQTQLDGKVDIAGDTMTGFLTLSADPTAVLHAATKQYVDNTTVASAGDTMTGFLTLNADPVNPLHAATKVYVDNLIAANIHWVAPVRDPDLQDIVSVEPTIGAGTIGQTFCYIKYGGVQGETWVQGGASIAVDDGDVAVFEITGTGPIIGDWIILQQGPLATGDRFIIAAEHGTIGATLTGMGFVNNDLLQYNGGVVTTGANWSTPHGTPPADGTTTLITDPDSAHYGHTYLYSADAGAWVEIIGGAAAIAEPLNQIVYGTGPTVDSDPDFTYNPTTGQFYVNTLDGSTGSVSSATPGNIGIVATGFTGVGDGGNVLIAGGQGGTTSGYGGSVTIQDGAPQVSGGGGGIFLVGSDAVGPGDFGGGAIELSAGDSLGTVAGGAISLIAGNCLGTVGGGDINLTAGNAGTGIQFGGFVQIIGGLGSTGGAGGNVTLTGGPGVGTPGNVVITGGLSADGDGGFVVLTGANGVGTDRNGGEVNITSGSGTGVGNPGDINLTAGAADLAAASTGGNIYLVGGTSGSLAGGVGGQVSINGGAPGGGDGAGGAVNLIGGPGSSTGTNGGSVTITGGALEDVGGGGGSPGSVTITGGTLADTFGAGSTAGDVVITAGEYIDNGGGGGGGGGNLSLVAGIADLGTGGLLTVSSGSATVAGSGGNAFFTSGSGETAGFNGGEVFVIAGNGANGAAGGNITIQAGYVSGTTVAAGGNVTVIGGEGAGTAGTPGNVYLQGGPTANVATTGGSANVLGGISSINGNGGGVNITGAAGVGTNRSGGNVTITAGAKTGTGLPGVIEFRSAYSEKSSAPTISAGTLLIDFANGNHFIVSLNADVTTLTVSNVPATANGVVVMTIAFTADGTLRTITWPASFKFPGGTAPTMTSTAGKIDVIIATSYDNGTSWLATATQNF